MAINLLPKDISQQSKVSSRGRSLTSLTYVMFTLAALVLLGGAALVFFQQKQVNSLKADQQNLLAEVKKYEQEERQLILVKDRLALVKDVLDSRDLEHVRDLQKVLYDSLPDGIILSQQQISDKTNEFTLHANSARVLRDYIKEIHDKEDFSAITLSQLIYNPSFGYQIKLEVN